MKPETFSLRSQEYIQLDQLLKLQSLLGTGDENHDGIDEGMMIVDGETELRRRNELCPDRIEL